MLEKRVIVYLDTGGEVRKRIEISGGNLCEPLSVSLINQGWPISLKV